MQIPDPGGSIADQYQLIEKLGSGVHGRVFKVRDRSTGETRAMKFVRIFAGERGPPSPFLREIESLQSLDHPNIVKCHSFHNSAIILDYCEYDLSALICSHHRLPLKTARSYMHQLLLGLSAVHTAGFVHRDIKPPNILVTVENVVKLADFGLARPLPRSDDGPLSKSVVTPCYRSPEVLLGDRKYGFGVDIWSLACVFYEIATGQILFPSSHPSDSSQLFVIFLICGLPSLEEWPELVDLPGYEMISKADRRPSNLDRWLDKRLSPEFLVLKNLLVSMLKINPRERISAEEALNHPFFTDCDPEELTANALPRIGIPECHGVNGRPSVAPCNALMRPGRVRAPAIAAF
jgi:serine/threonine protein kinase